MKGLPKKWEWKKLGEICEVKKGTSITQSKISQGGIPVIAGGQQPAYYHNLANRTGKTITVSASGAYAGFINYFEIPIFASDCTTIQSNDENKLLTKFVFLMLKSKQKEVYTLQTGSGQPHVYAKDLVKIEIPLPPLPIQHKIVSILEKAESLKQKRELANEEANKIIQSIFYDMFGNKGFEKRKLKEFTSLISSGSTPLGGSKNYLTQGEFLFIRSQNVLMNKFSQHEKLFISSDIHNNMKRTWVKKNDVLLNITGASIGRTAIYNGEDNKANVNQHVCIIRLNQTSKISNVYLNFFLSSQEMQDYILKRNAGATRQALNFTQIGNFEIPLPPISLQKQFASIVEKIESIKHKQNLATEEISTLFDALMQKAFNGELTE
jgi:restriction endonuclease S subunit